MISGEKKKREERRRLDSFAPVFWRLQNSRKTTSNQRDTFFLFLFNDPADFFLSVFLSCCTGIFVFVCVPLDFFCEKRKRKRTNTHKHTHTPQILILSKKKKKKLRNKNRARSDNCPEVTRGCRTRMQTRTRGVYEEANLDADSFFFFLLFFEALKTTKKKKHS